MEYHAGGRRMPRQRHPGAFHFQCFVSESRLVVSPAAGLFASNRVTNVLLTMYPAVPLGPKRAG